MIEGRIKKAEQWNMFSAEILAQTILLQGLFQKLNWLFPDLCFRSFLSGCFQGTMIILDNSDCGETYNSKYKDACELLKLFLPVKNVVENQEGDAVKNVVENQEGLMLTKYDNHMEVHCPKRVNVAKPVTITKSSIVPGTSEVNDEGFVEVKNRKKKGKNVNNAQAPKATTYGTAATPQASGEKSTPTSNAFDVLTLEAKNESSKRGNEEAQSKGHGSLWENFKAIKEASSSKSNSTSSDPISSNADYDFGNPESDEDGVFDPDDTSYMSSFGGGNQLEDDFSDGYEAQVNDELVQNAWAVKIKNIDGKVVGRKAIRGIQSVASDGGAVDASCIDGSCNKDGDDCQSVGKDDYSTSRLKKNSNSVTFHNLDTNIPTANEKPCDDEQSQVHDQSKDSKIKGKKEGNAWNTPFIKSVSLVSEPDGGLAQKKMIKIMELHNEEVVEGAVVAIPLVAVEEGRNTYARALIEVSEAKALLDLLVVAIPLPNGKGHTLETIKIEYEWKPPRCESCKFFDHIDTYCPKRVELPKPMSNIQWHQKKIDGSKKDYNAKPTSGDTKDGDLKVPSPTHATSDVNTPFGSSKANDDKVLEEDNLWSRFQISKKASKSQDHKDASEDESEVEEYPRYDSTGLSSICGSFSLEDDDLACYDGYEA
nr:zinc knuckle CX2CX4HX4C [Tanacetum cinerariifolium]